MFDNFLRPIKEKLFIPMAKGIGKYIHPNGLSVISFLFGIASGIFIFLGMLELAFGLWIFNRIFDGLDGTVARVTDTQSDFGGYLDIMLDFVIYAYLPVMFVFSPLLEVENMLIRYLSLVIMLGIFYINGASWMYLSAILEKRKAGASETGESTTVTMPGGIIGGSETILFYSFFYLLPAYLDILFWVMSALVFIGVIQRLVWAGRHLE